MKRLIVLGGALAIAGSLLGCGRSAVMAPVTASSAATARARIMGILARAPQVVDESQFASGEASSLGGAPAGAFAAIHPLRFWRSITHVDRHVDIAFSDPDSAGNPRRALVTVTKVLTGQFNIASQSGSGDSMVVVHKPLEDHWKRDLLFIRVPHDAERDSMEGDDGEHRSAGPDGSATGSDDDEDWRLVGTSAVQVTSRDATTRIVSLRIQATGLDTTLTDPLAIFRLRGVVRFDPGDLLTLTLTTQRNDDAVFLMLHGHRIAFTNNGDDTYTTRLQLPAEEDVDELRHIGVNALSHGTLFDDQMPYDSQAWIAPFMVKPNLMAGDIH